MPLAKEMLEKHVKPLFVETGTFHGEAVAMALELGFGRVVTVEWNPEWAAEVAARYRGDARVRVLQGDSADHLTKVVPTINGPATFWLDAHPLVTPMPLFDPQFPLLRELLTIKRFLKGTGHTILIDDLRTFSQEERAMLVFAMKQLWPEAEHSFYSDRIATDDVYCCVI